MNTLKMFCVIFFICSITPVVAQKVTVTKGSERIKGKNTEGYVTELVGNSEEVTTSFSKYLKTFGKIRLFNEPLVVIEAEVNSVKYTVPIHGVIRQKGEKVLVWLGVDHSADTAQLASAKRDFEKIVYDFGVKFYRDKIQVDIDESTQAQQAVEKQASRLQNESKNLASRLEFNQKEKIRLEKALIDNKVEYEALLLNIANNKKSQDSLVVVMEQVKKMVELHKERQKKVN